MSDRSAIKVKGLNCTAENERCNGYDERDFLENLRRKPKRSLPMLIANLS